MECIQNKIGIKGCGVPQEGVQLFVNQLPGVTIENVTALIDDEQETLPGLWADIVLRTMLRFELMVKAAFNKCYKITNKETIECLVCENAQLFYVALWYLHGTELMTERLSTDNLNRYTTIDSDKAEELQTMFYGEFEESLKDAINSIDPNESDCTEGCVECRKTVNWSYTSTSL